MNASLISLEISVVLLGLVLLLADLFMPAGRRKYIGYAAIAALGVLLALSLTGQGSCSLTGTAFNGSFINDGLSLFFKRLFLVAAILVLFIAVEFSDRLKAVSEYYSLIVFALVGMLFAASSNDFAMLFVSIELIEIAFYILVSFQRGRLIALEAGVKYLIQGALSSAFLVFGIALIWGSTGQLNFDKLADFLAQTPQVADSKIFLLGILLVLVSLGFKISMVPFQIWTPDVYQGAPTPTTAFLAIGSKAAGFVLLLRVLFSAVPTVTHGWASLFMVLSGLTIIYGNLCAIPQRNIKRLLGYSSISHAGYLLLGVAALNASGQAAILYYLFGYVFTVLAAFLVIAIVLRHLEAEDISGLAGLNQRSPLLAATMTISMASLGGIPPLVGFFGKFLLFRSAIEAGQTTGNHAYYWLVFIAVAGVVVSLYYYFGVVRAIYWSKEISDVTPIQLSGPAKVSMWICVVGIFWLGMFPNALVNYATEAVKALGN